MYQWSIDPYIFPSRDGHIEISPKTPLQLKNIEYTAPFPCIFMLLKISSHLECSGINRIRKLSDPFSTRFGPSYVPTTGVGRKHRLFRRRRLSIRARLAVHEYKLNTMYFQNSKSYCAVVFDSLYTPQYAVFLQSSPPFRDRLLKIFAVPF